MSSTAAVVAAPKVSWLKKIGQDIGKVLTFFAQKAPAVAVEAGTVASLLMPQFAPEVTVAENLVTNIAKEAVAVEGAAAAAGTAGGTGVQKLAAVVANVGPAIDTWVQSSFPGASAVSTASKAGLVNAVVAIMNELSPATATSPNTPPAPPQPA
jgi:hypothetical protein